MNNIFMNPITNQASQATNKSYIKCLKLEEETYNIKIKKLKPYQISIECENQFDYLSTHQYSITLSYDEFCKLGKTFRLSDNIDEIFDTIKNLFKGVDFTFKNDNNIYPFQWSNNFNQEMDSNTGSNVKLERSTNGSITLILKIPLLNEKYENIKIELKKESKDIKTQFEKLKKKFLKIKKIAFSDETEKNGTINNQQQFQNFQQPFQFNQLFNPNLKFHGNQQNFQGNQPQYMNNQRQFQNPGNQSFQQIKPTAETILSQIKNEFKNDS